MATKNNSGSNASTNADRQIEVITRGTDGWTGSGFDTSNATDKIKAGR